MKKQLTYSQMVRKDRRWGKARNLCIRNRENDICYLCGRLIDFNLRQPGNPMNLEVDHIIPLTKGGAPFDQNNLACVHKICNIKKSDFLKSDQVVKERIAALKKEKIEVSDSSGIDFISFDEE